MESSKLILDDNRGIYIPLNFVQDFDLEQFSGWEQDDIDTIQDGPDNEQYWDAWDRILNNIYHVDQNGYKWILEQDGAVWMVCPELEPDFITVNVYNIEWETDGAEVDLPEQVEIVLETETDDGDELSDLISDELSDEYGFLHNGFDYEIVE